jgi:hypothetical protein
MVNECCKLRAGFSLRYYTVIYWTDRINTQIMLLLFWSGADFELGTFKT